MPSPQVAAQLKSGSTTLKFDDEFSQPTVSVEFGNLSTTHETIGNDKITQVYGEKATRIQLEGVIRQDQIETAYDLSEPGSNNSGDTVKVVLEEWSGTAVVDDNASIKPRREIYSKDDGTSHWLYDLSMSFIEVDRKSASNLVQGDPRASNQTSNNSSSSDSSSSDSSSSDSSSSDSSGSDSSSSGSDEFPDLAGSDSNFEQSRTIETDETLLTSDIEERAETDIQDAAPNVTQVSFSNTELRRGGSGDGTASVTATYYHSSSGKSGKVDIKYTLKEEEGRF